MAELKTKKTDGDAEAFIAAIPDAGRRGDARAVMELMGRLTGEKPAMWGDSIVGFGKRHLKYASGRELDWMVVGLSPRKSALTLYLPLRLEQAPELLAGLGKHTTGKGCLYIKNLADVDRPALERLVEAAIERAGEEGDGGA